MSSTDITPEEAHTLFQRTVESLLADGCSILAAPLLLANPGDEVYPALLEWYKSASDEQLDAWEDGDFDAVSKWLGLPLETVSQHRPMGEMMLFWESQRQRGIDQEHSSDDSVFELLGAWLDSFADGHLFDPKRPEIQTITVSEVYTVSTSEAPAIPTVELATILRKPPVNAWLLVGDDRSFLTPNELDELRNNPEARMGWTALSQIQPGDLVFIYFMAPRKAVHFVARAASHPVFNPDNSVNANKEIYPQQWWVDLVDIEPVAPVSFSDLSDLMGGHLILRGKPTHYLPPRVVAGLSRLIGKRHEIPLPVGSPDLPNPATMTFEQWKAFSTGPLLKERQIEEHVVEPLLRLALAGNADATTQGQMKISAGIPDYVVRVGNQVTGAVEVKIGVQTPPDGDWTKSPEIQQILRYMRHLDTPGILIDANRVFFLDRGADRPTQVVERKEMTFRDLESLAVHLTMK